MAHLWWCIISPRTKKKSDFTALHFTYISIFCREKKDNVFICYFCGFFVTFLSFSRTNHTMSTSSLLKTITIQNSLMITCHTRGFTDRKQCIFYLAFKKLTITMQLKLWCFKTLSARQRMGDAVRFLHTVASPQEEWDWTDIHAQPFRHSQLPKS